MNEGTKTARAPAPITAAERGAHLKAAVGVEAIHKAITMPVVAETAAELKLRQWQAEAGRVIVRKPADFLANLKEIAAGQVVAYRVED